MYDPLDLPRDVCGCRTFRCGECGETFELAGYVDEFGRWTPHNDDWDCTECGEELGED